MATTIGSIEIALQPVIKDVQDAAQAATGSFLKREPVVLLHLAAAVVGYVMSLLITHGVITDTQASAVTQQAVSGAVAAALALQGLLVRRYVTPAWKRYVTPAGVEVLHRSDSEVSEEMDPEPDNDGEMLTETSTVPARPSPSHAA